MFIVSHISEVIEIIRLTSIFLLSIYALMFWFTFDRILMNVTDLCICASLGFLIFFWQFELSSPWMFLQEVGLKDLTSKNHMKVVLRWMRERQKLRLVCNHVGAHKQFLYTTWFTKPGTAQTTTTTTTTTTRSIPSKKKPTRSWNFYDQ